MSDESFGERRMSNEPLDLEAIQTLRHAVIPEKRSGLVLLISRQRDGLRDLLAEVERLRPFEDNAREYTVTIGRMRDQIAVVEHRAEQAGAKVQVLETGIRQFMESIRDGDSGLATYTRLEALIDHADTTTEKE